MDKGNDDTGHHSKGWEYGGGWSSWQPGSSHGNYGWQATTAATEEFPKPTHPKRENKKPNDLPCEPAAVLGVRIMAQELKTAEDVKWFYEEGGRLYNASMLPLEEKALRSHKWPTTKDKNDMLKVVANYGSMRGATVNGQRLLKTTVKGMDYSPGDMVSVKSVGFSLCKHLFLSYCKKMCNDKHDVQCFCMPKTALMPSGCSCIKTSLLTNPIIITSVRLALIATGVGGPWAIE